MADYFTHFSCLFEVGAGNVEAALALYAQMAHDLEADDGLSIGFVVQPATGSASALWLHDEDHGEPEHVIAFALLCAETFDLRGRWGFSWALTCSRARLDAFGGGAQLLDLGARTSLAWVDCADWLARRLPAASPTEQT